MSHAYQRQHDLDCKCPQCQEFARLRLQHLTTEQPMQGLPTGAVSLHEIGVDYQVLEDWSDD